MHIEVWQSNLGAKQWHWHFLSKGRITACAESFPTKSHALRAAKAVVRGVLKRLSTATFHPDPPRFESSVSDGKLIVKWY